MNKKAYFQLMGLNKFAEQLKYQPRPVTRNLKNLKEKPTAEVLTNLGFKNKGIYNQNNRYQLNVPYRELYLNLYSGQIDNGAAARAQFQRTQRNRAKNLGQKYNPNKYYPVPYHKIQGDNFQGKPSGIYQKIFQSMPIKQVPQNIGFMLPTEENKNTFIQKGLKGYSYPQSLVRDLMQNRADKSLQNLFGLFESRNPQTYGKLLPQPYNGTSQQIAHLLTSGNTTSTFNYDQKAPWDVYRKHPFQLAADFNQIKGTAANMGYDIKSLKQLKDWALVQGYLKRKENGRLELGPRINDTFSKSQPQASKHSTGYINLRNGFNAIQDLQHTPKRTEEEQIQLDKLNRLFNFMLQNASTYKYKKDYNQPIYS